MIDAAYYRRQAATCRAVAGEFRDAVPLLDLADYFERLAAEAGTTDGAGRRSRRPVAAGYAAAYSLDAVS